MNHIITKVGGKEEELKTKMYRVQVRSLEDRRAYVIPAIGIPSISEDIAHVEVTDIAQKLGLRRKQRHLGHEKTDLLIRIDQAKLHIGETKEVGNIYPPFYVVPRITHTSYIHSCHHVLTLSIEVP